MRETGDVLYESGHVVDVTVVTLGDELTADAAAGATVLSVGDCADFDAGGIVLINGATYAVGAVDDDANTITLTSGLADDADDGDVVEVWDPLYQVVSSFKSVQVRVLSEDSNEDVVEATLMNHLVDQLDEGIRGAHGESVRMQLDGDEWLIVDVLGFGESVAATALGQKYEADDAHTVSASDVSDDEAVITLTYRPIPESLKLWWGGLGQEPTEYTIDYDAQTVTVPLGGVVLAGDRLWVHYAYRSGPAPQVIDFESSGWRYLEVAEADAVDRSGPGFDDSGWNVGRGAFGNVVAEDSTPFVLSPVDWNVPNTVIGPPVDFGLWIRRAIPQIPGGASVSVQVRLDGDCTVYWNGTEVDTRYSDGTFDVDPIEIPNDLVSGQNVLAIHLVDDITDPSYDFIYIDARVEW